MSCGSPSIVAVFYYVLVMHSSSVLGTYDPLCHFISIRF